MNYLCILAIVINVFQMLSGRNFPRKRKFYRAIALHTRRSVCVLYRKCTTAETTRTRTRAKVVISCSTFSNADHGYVDTKIFDTVAFPTNTFRAVSLMFDSICLVVSSITFDLEVLITSLFDSYHSCTSVAHFFNIISS